MKILFLSLFLFFAKTIFCQNFNPNIKLTGTVKVVDSQYLVIPELKVFSDNQHIKIHKKLSYGNEANTTADIYFYLQKVIGHDLVNMYVQAFRLPMPDNDYNVLTRFTTKSVLKDTINLNEYFPFEQGDYRVQLVLKYYNKSVKHEVNSEWINFKVVHQGLDRF